MGAAIIRLPHVGEYVTDGKRLLQVMEVSPAGEYVLEDCSYASEDSSRIRLSESRASELRLVRAA